MEVYCVFKPGLTAQQIVERLSLVGIILTEEEVMYENECHILFIEEDILDDFEKIDCFLSAFSDLSGVVKIPDFDFIQTFYN
jgi:hypothetical protein